MAKKQVVSVSYTCDVCGDEIPDSASEGATHKIRWESAEYVVDVCTTHAAELDDLLSKLKGFVDVGYRAGLRRGRRSSASTSTRSPRSGAAAPASASAGAAPKRGDLGTIRAWAQSNGHKVGDRGRIPAAVVEAYEAAHSAQSAPAAEPETESSAAPAPAATTKAAPRKRTPRKSTASSNGSAATKAAPRKRSPRKAAAAASAPASA